MMRQTWSTMLLVTILIVVTLLSFEIERHEFASKWSEMAVLAIAGFKARIILREFMEARSESLALRVFADIWLCYVLAVIAVPIIAQ